MSKPVPPASAEPMNTQFRCGHRSQIVDLYKTRTDANGHTSRVLIPQTFRPRGKDAYYCPGCWQFVDAIDDAEREQEKP